MDSESAFAPGRRRRDADKREGTPCERVEKKAPKRGRNEACLNELLALFSVPPRAIVTASCELHAHQWHTQRRPLTRAATSARQEQRTLVGFVQHTTSQHAPTSPLMSRTDLHVTAGRARAAMPCMPPKRAAKYAPVQHTQGRQAQVHTFLQHGTKLTVSHHVDKCQRPLSLPTLDVGPESAHLAMWRCAPVTAAAAVRSMTRALTRCPSHTMHDVV